MFSRIMHSPRSLPLLTLAAVAAALLLWLSHAQHYFFLYDDYLIVHTGETDRFATYTSRLYFGYYRPFLFLVYEQLFPIFTWSRPSGYAALSVALHGVNSLLVACMARQLPSLSTRSLPLLAGSFFFFATRSGEAVFWVSSQFDLMSATGILLCLLLCMRVPTTRAFPLLLAGIAATAAIAFFSKEMAITLPALAAILMATQTSLRGLFRTRSVITLLTLAAVAGAYLQIRSHIAPTLSGPYGDFFAMLETLDVPALIAAFTAPPFSPSFTTTPTFVYRILTCIALLRCLWKTPRLFLLLAAAFSISLLPVLWVSVEPGVTTSGHLLYLPCVFFLIAVAHGIASLQPPTRLTIAGIYCALSLVSMHYQYTLWGIATHTARTAMTYWNDLPKSPGTSYHITNMPAWLVEGPYLLQPYAFTYYKNHPKLQVTVTKVSLSAADGLAIAETLGKSGSGTPITLPIPKP